MAISWNSLRLVIITGLIVLAYPLVAVADDTEAAAELFGQGEELYSSGSYKKAIVAFSAAQELAPHPATQFNIARSYQNLGDLAKAIKHYELARAATKDAGLRCNILERISRLRKQPTTVFVSSEPPGASVVVDGQAEGEAMKTPVAIKMLPGTHVVTLTLEGYRESVHPVVAEVGKEATVKATLLSESDAVRQVEVRVEVPVEVEVIKLVEPPPLTPFDGGRAHLEAGVTTMAIKSWGAIWAPSGLLAFSYDRVSVGLMFQYYPLPSDIAGGFANLMIVGGEASFAFPIDNSYLYALASLAGYVDRNTGAEPTGGGTRPTNETSGIIWGLGGGVHAMLIKQMSVGMNIRGGVAHGGRIDPDDPELKALLDDHIFPYVAISGALGFHL